MKILKLQLGKLIQPADHTKVLKIPLIGMSVNPKDISLQIALDILLSKYKKSLNSKKWHVWETNPEGEKLGEMTLNRYKNTYKNPAELKRWIGEAGSPETYKFLKSIYIHEDPENNDAINYFKSYVNSKGYNRILNNLDKWYTKRHPFRRFTQSSNIDNLKKAIRKLANNPPNIFSTNLHTTNSFYNLDQRNIYMGTSDIEEPFTGSEYPFIFTLGHEVGHSIQPKGILGFTYFGNAQEEALDLNLNTKKNKHDEENSEKHADLWGLKYLLYKEGIYDSRSNKDITEEQVLLLRNKYPKLRPLQLMDNKLLTKQLNIIASKDKTLNNLI